MLMMVLANNGPGLVVYGVAYYELEPPYVCTYNSPQFATHEASSFAINEDGENTAYYTMACDTKAVCGTGDD